jgi:hypothetical protein
MAMTIVENPDAVVGGVNTHADVQYELLGAMIPRWRPPLLT